ncbi:hypothetical protein [Erythrobacter sp. MTPC3]|uniref:hypothetical protein n=1 Tax=Erythrobacter sp. MTPC3 TaxID=3056564 RepID=UPI0036F324DF
MSDSLLTALQIYGAASGLVAALIVSLNLGAQWTGWGFVIFVTSSAALVAWAFLGEQGLAVGWQNVGLLCINGVGVYRYLFVKAPEEKEDTE